jgi:pantetheine-phosphate adenylyltransferase
MITQSRTAVYARSFDPVTLGHMWMIKQVSSMFDKLVVAVGTNPDKTCHFSLNERIEMFQRNSIDYEYEKSISYNNRDLNPDIVTVFLLPPRDMVEFSSSIVRGLIGLEGWEDIVGKYVPACLLRRLISENKSQASQI